MAVISEWSAEREAEWAAWVASRPPVIADVARRFPPNRLFRMKSTGHRVYVLAYAEDGTMRVAVSGAYNRVVFGRNVFGIPPDDLEECDLPGPEEDVGDTSQEAGYSEKDVREILIPRMKADRAAQHRKPT